MLMLLLPMMMMMMMMMTTPMLLLLPVMMIFILRCLWLMTLSIYSAVNVALSFNPDLSMDMCVCVFNLLFSSPQVEIFPWSTSYLAGVVEELCETILRTELSLDTEVR
jgi:hypothetical protein